MASFTLKVETRDGHACLDLVLRAHALSKTISCDSFTGESPSLSAFHDESPTWYGDTGLLNTLASNYALYSGISWN